MLKALLFIGFAGFALPARSQADHQRPDGPAELVHQDPARVIDEFSCFPSGKTAAALSWKALKEIPDFFVIERSSDGISFETVSVMNKPGIKPSYQWTDDAPKKGKNYYRIRYSFGNGQPLFSPTASCMVEGATSFKFYPNPANNILIVRSDSPVDVQITDGSGHIRITEVTIQGLRTINVSNLEKGIYVIRFNNKLTNVIFQDKLVKN